MLDEYTIRIIKSTVPILEKHAEQLTYHFYKRMFSHNPEVIPLFNSAHQSTGHQQKALAGAICSYAANIDNLEALGSSIELIAQKHASLQIKPKHYPIVGQNLLASIQEILGNGATDEVIQAWAQAYDFLANILIGRETQIYKQHATTTGGWQGFKAMRVIKKEIESSIITSFYLASLDGKKPPQFKPGQYITVRVPTPDETTTMRNYSLSNQPGEDWLRISVKREQGYKANIPDGYVSNYLHDNIDIGSILEIAPPCGEFFLDITEKHERPLVLLSAGVGITPILSILLSAVTVMSNREIIFIHGSLNENVHAFKNNTNSLAKKHHNLKVYYRYSDPEKPENLRKGMDSTGLIDAQFIESLVSQRDCDYYFCGPHPFMINIYHELLAWGIPPAQVHFEFFGPNQELEKKQLQ
ncbi:NO-inducible flavohemoprotein [Candidatus Berkiella cookevillensis]|uniref:Flavohemoprotein n=1 Tax=Candidatus Berkiella cookevillensis TaxID=437022 RepID=A0A0Q9YP91_9GAMM|nr:NO-inducible flavohemoprotein [Candidatus Berkiella cookevillensis]MCS5708690.1 NO-inducible flavohemoprotein [Candidatus Berkiella cookevillensis]